MYLDHMILTLNIFVLFSILLLGVIMHLHSVISSIVRDETSAVGL